MKHSLMKGTAAVNDTYSKSSKKTGILGLMLVFVFVSTFAQTDQGLQAEINQFNKLYQKEQNDSLKLVYLTDMAQRWRFVNIDSSKYYLWKAIAAHKKRGVNPISHAFAYNVIADIYRLEPNKDSTRHYFEEAYHHFSRQANSHAFLAIAPSYGYFLIKNNEVEKGINIFQDCMSIAEQNKDFKSLSILHGNLGHLFYTVQKDNDHAIELYLKGLAFAKKMTDQHKYERIFTAINTGLSTIYLEIGEIEKAINYAEQAIESGKKVKLYQKILIAYNNLVECYMKMGQYDQANEYNLQASKLSLKVKAIAAIINTKIHEQAIQLHLRKYPKCISKGHLILARYRQHLDSEMNAKVYEHFCECYLRSGNSQKALEAKDSLLHYTTKAMDLKQEKRLAQLYNDFAVKEQKVKNKLLNTQKRATEEQLATQQFAALGLVVALIFALAWATTVYRSNVQKKKHNEELEDIVALRTKELQVANTDLKQSNAELRTLTYIASHDIKEPIRNIGNFAGFIQRKLPPKLRTELDPEFKIIKKNTRQLYTLIEDFAKYTSLSKDKTLDTEPVNLNEVLHNIKTNLSVSSSNDQVKIHTEKLPTIETNPSAIYFILKNLIDNALKYNQSDQPMVALSSDEGQNEIKITVQDNGIGIAPEFQRKIFEPFKRLHDRSEYDGSGIGLSIVRLLIEKLNGQIEVESQIDQGSQFILTFPKG